MAVASEASVSPSRALAPARAKRVLQFAALVLATVAAALLAFLPVYEGVTSDSSGSSTETSATLLQVNGPWILVLLAVPIVLTALPLVARGAAWQPLSITAAILLGVLVVIGMLSIGIFFVPAMIVEVIAACLPTRRMKA